MVGLPEGWEVEALERDKADKKVVLEAGKKLGISWEAAHRIMEMAVERGCANREIGEVKHLGLDEKSFLKGQNPEGSEVS